MRARAGSQSGKSFTLVDYDVRRFWERVQKSDGCWVWTGSTNGFRRKYGQLTLDCRRTVGAHRVSYVIAHGALPEGMVVCHACDNTLCVRPDHLFLGTQKDNVRDMIAKGRFRFHRREKPAA